MTYRNGAPGAVRLAGGLLFFLFLSVSCGGNLFTYRGAATVPDRRIALEEDGSFGGAWQTRDVSLNYRCEAKSGGMEFSTDGRIARYIEESYLVIEYFNLTLFFLDSEGIVSGSERFTLAEFRSPVWEFSFRRNIEPPENTSAIAFGYSGKAVRYGGMEPWKFRHAPIE